MLVTSQYKLTRTKLLSLLGEIEHDSEKAITMYLLPGATESAAYIEKIPELIPIKAEVEKKTNSSQTGTVIFWGPSHKLLIMPPFPLKDKYVASGYDVALLRALLEPDYRIGIVLVRLGSYSIGITEGERLILHNTGTGLVHGRQRQGGSSAARFQRRRQDQAHHFLERVGEHARELIKAYGKNLDYFVYGGARTTIQQLRKQCGFFEQFDENLLPPLLEIPEPRFNVLEKAVNQIWSSRVIEWREE